MADPNQGYYDNSQNPPPYGDQPPMDAQVDVQYDPAAYGEQQPVYSDQDQYQYDAADPQQQYVDQQQQYMDQQPQYVDQQPQYVDQQQQYVDQTYDGQQPPPQQEYDVHQEYNGQQEFDGQQMMDGQHATQEYDGQYYGGEGDGVHDVDYQIPDVMLLNHYCGNAHPPKDASEEAKHEADLSWEPVREWLRSHSAEEVRAAAQERGDSSMTALHVSCRNVPPSDVIEVLLSIAGDTAQWQDSFGWLPIHYACACGADTQVIKSLAEAFPESKTTVDRRGRTPLHFALGNSNPDSPVSPAVVVLLSSTGAASFADDNGMLPLHYACAYGASEEALYVLTDAHDQAITTMDSLGRTPLHFALSNAGRKAAPAAVRLLLTLHKEIVNATGGGPLPLRVLAEYATTVRKGETSQRESVSKCLDHLLSFNPAPTADFFTALQALPDWLQDRAVVTPSVQTLLNVKIAQRFPTGVLLSDFFVQILVILFYALVESYDRREQKVDVKWLVLPLYCGAAYFFARFLLQVISLLALGAFRVWLQDASNWLDIFYVVLVFFWAVRFGQNPDTWGEGPDTLNDNKFYREAAALSVIVLWMKFLSYLRNTYIDFAVFLGGLFYVVKRLVAFLLCLCIILIAFSQMFYTIYQQSKLCLEDGAREDLSIEDRQCGEDARYKYCNRWDAFLNTFTMLLGEVDDEQFKENKFAVVLFALFMFLVVILLANVLIAIVTDSYKVIQDQRAAIVFWTNRLDFVAEMDGIANGPWKTTLKKMLGISTKEDTTSDEKVTFGKDTWKRLMDLLFEEEIDDGALSFEFICYVLMRFVTFFLIIPLWLLFGLLSFGSLWPPQVRERIFTSKVLKHSSEAEKDDELRKKQVKVLKDEVQVLKDDLMQELAIDRTQVVQMKSLVAERKQEIQGEMKHIKRIVAMLFEQQSSM